MPPLLQQLACVSDDDSPPSQPRATQPARQRLDWPLAIPTDPLWRAALEADATGTPSNLSSAWEDLVRGELRVWCESIGLERIYLLARVNVGPSVDRYALTSPEAAIVLRVLCGDSQKLIATELGVAPSTASNRCTRAIDKLDLGSGALPLPLVVAAQACAGVVASPHGRSARFEYQGCDCLVMSVPRPVTAGIDALTPAEREVAQLLIEGRSRYEISHHRSSSPNTVASQIHSIFVALGVTGRHAVIRRAIELGCFGKQANRS
jgi:DNA-binding NarL/FixJ family response regulator